MRFLHTADWQIGMKAAALGDAGARVREERLAAGRRKRSLGSALDIGQILETQRENSGFSNCGESEHR